jgi:glycosyltransferase involved in cell wall biosynthesis
VASSASDFDVGRSTFGVRRSPPHLAFVGDGPYLKELRQLLPGAAFTGYLAGLELARAFASSDVFLFPSTTDTFGNVILEALASGVPCVVSMKAGPKDLIEHGAPAM